MYEALAPAYESLNTDADYNAIADFLFGILAEHGIKDGIMLDLACGTGALTRLAKGAGFDMIGLDVSPEMLSFARSQSDGITYICQDMRELDLFGTFRACLCSLDAINHITDPRDLYEVFRRVRLFCEKDGVFIFDINTPRKLERLDGSAFVDEDDENYVVWSVERIDGRLYEFVVDVFRKHKNVYKRETDIFCEYAYSIDELTEMLEKTGFTVAAVYGDRVKKPPAADEDRIYIVAKAG